MCYFCVLVLLLFDASVCCLAVNFLSFRDTADVLINRSHQGDEVINFWSFQKHIAELF